MPPKVPVKKVAVKKAVKAAKRPVKKTTGKRPIKRAATPMTPLQRAERERDEAKQKLEDFQNQVRQVTRDYPGGCPQGKNDFLSRLDLTPDPKSFELTVRLTVEPDDVSSFDADDVADDVQSTLDIYGAGISEVSVESIRQI